MASTLCAACVKKDVMLSGGQLTVAVRDFADDPTLTTVDFENLSISRDSEVELQESFLFVSTPRESPMGALVQDCLAKRAFSAGETNCEISNKAFLGSEIDWGASVGIWAGAGLATVVLCAVLGDQRKQRGGRRQPMTSAAPPQDEPALRWLLIRQKELSVIVSVIFGGLNPMKSILSQRSAPSLAEGRS
jgi:hypothetical protein